MVTKILDNHDEVFNILGMPLGGLFVTEFRLKQWGKELEVHFRYNPHTDDKPFTLRFKDCSSIHWEEVGSEIDEENTVADVIGSKIGEKGHQKPAIITTDLFTLIVTYGELILDKNW